MLRLTPGQAVKAHPKPATRAALYVRVSTKGQADKWSLPAQRQILTDQARKYGWDPMLYDEGGASAETIEGRPVLQRLLADVAAGRIDLVAVVEMERLCRASDLRDWATITTTFRDAGVPMVTPERVFNLETAEDDFEADLRGILSKREKRKLLERTQRGLDLARDAGKFTGGVPSGYRFDPVTRKIVPDPDTVPLVRRIFESGLSPWKLHKALLKEGTYLPYSTIRRIRANPAYVALRPNTEGQLVKADWEPLVDETTWKRCQGRSEGAARRSPRPAGPGYLLAGIIRCRRCHGAVVGRPIRPSKSGTPLFVYRCLQPHRCPRRGGQLPGWTVDLLVTDALTEYVKDPFLLKQRYQRALDATQGPDLARRREELEARARDLDERESRLVDAVERGVLPDRLAKRRLKDLETAREALRRDLEPVEAGDAAAAFPEFKTILDRVKGLAGASLAEKRDLLKLLAATVEADSREQLLVVTWRLGGEAWYRVPRLRGGPGRSAGRALEIVSQRVAEYRLSPGVR